MDVSILAQALTAFLAPLLPFLIRVGEKSVEEVRKKIGDSVWSLAKKVWGKLQPELDANPVSRSIIHDVIQSPSDEDTQAALRLQIKKLLQSNPVLAQELSIYFDEIQQSIATFVAGDVTDSTFISGTSNVYQHGVYNVNVGRINRVVLGKENRIAEVQEVEVSFRLPDGSYPTHYWVKSLGLVRMLLNRDSKVSKEWWKPGDYDLRKLKQVVLDEINKWTRAGWELVEPDPDNLFITEYGLAETIASSVSSLLGLPTGLAWKHWRIYYGARFHVRRYLD